MFNPQSAGEASTCCTLRLRLRWSALQHAPAFGCRLSAFQLVSCRNKKWPSGLQTCWLLASILVLLWRHGAGVQGVASPASLEKGYGHVEDFCCADPGSS